MLSSEQFAYLKGSYVDPGLVLENQRYFTINIDSMPVDDAEQFVDDYHMLPSGKRTLIVQFTQSTYTATADFIIDVLPGQKLQVLGRIVSTNTTMLGVDIPDQVGFKIRDVTTNLDVTNEVIRPVIQTATPIYPPIARTLMRAL